MKTYGVLLLAAFTVATASFAALGDIVGSFAMPGNYGVWGLGISSNYLYATAYTPGRIYMLNATTGSVLGSFAAAGGSYTHGLAFDGAYLWQNTADYTGNYAYKTIPNTGSVIASYATWNTGCVGAAPRATGDYGAGTDAIFVSDPVTDWIFVMNTSGSLLSSFKVPPICIMHDIAYDWRNQLIWGAAGPYIHGVNTSGSLVTSFTLPITDCYGIEYADQYLWCGNTLGWVYRVDCPNVTGASPVSVGRIKALYR